MTEVNALFQAFACLMSAHILLTKWSHIIHPDPRGKQVGHPHLWLGTLKLEAEVARRGVEEVKPNNAIYHMFLPNFTTEDEKTLLINAVTVLVDFIIFFKCVKSHKK